MAGLRALIYRLKRGIHRYPRLYAPVYALLTLNLERLRRWPLRRRYPSAFGGLWTDRSDFEPLLQAQLGAGRVQPAQLPLLRQWREEGWVVFRGALDETAVDRLLAELSNLPQRHPPGLLITGGGPLEARPYRPELLRAHDSVRVVDYHHYSAAARALLFHPAITDFLRLVFQDEPLLTQSLSFEHGSEQAIHQDTAFVIMNSPLRFAAAWIALEDVREGSGELQYYPGSHRWGDFRFSGRFKHWDRERDGEAQLQAWYAWMDEQARQRSVRRQRFLARKGDVLIWHGGLAHGGAPIRDAALTRRSLVGHYCASDTRPLYHYYKPAHRAIHGSEAGRYSSSHYRPGA